MPRARLDSPRATVGRAGESQKASNLLAPVDGWFTEGFDTPELQAKSLLDELAKLRSN